jgi:hypothetical protein
MKRLITLLFACSAVSTFGQAVSLTTLRATNTALEAKIALKANSASPTLTGFVSYDLSTNRYLVGSVRVWDVRWTPTTWSIWNDQNLADVATFGETGITFAQPLTVNAGIESLNTSGFFVGSRAGMKSTQLGTLSFVSGQAGGTGTGSTISSNAEFRGIVTLPNVGSNASPVAGIGVDASGNMTKIPIGGGSGVGDVVGPGSATDNAIARFDSTTGKLIQNSAVTVDDSGNVSTAGRFTAAGATFSGTAGLIDWTMGTNAIDAAPTNYVLNPNLGTVQLLQPTNDINIVHVTNTHPTIFKTNTYFTWIVDTRGSTVRPRLSWPDKTAGGFNALGPATTNGAFLPSNAISRIDYANYGPGQSNTDLAIGYGN